MTNEQLAVFVLSIKNRLEGADRKELETIIKDLGSMNHILQGK